MCTLALFACGTTSTGVISAGKDTYTLVITGTGLFSFHNGGAFIKQAYEEANTFCAAHQKVLQPIASTWNPAGFGHYELRFRALLPDDPEYCRPNLEAVPDVEVDVQSQ